MAAFLENIILGKHYIGVELFSVNGGDRVAWLEAGRKKNELVIAKKEIININELFERQNSKLPLSIVINNAHVLQKETDSTDANDKKLVHKTFPNINLEEFYFEIMRLDGKSVIAICRKSYIHDLVERLGKKYNIMSVSLGILPISQVLNFSMLEVVYTNTQAINLDDSGLPLITPFEGDKIFDINGLAVPNGHLLAFSSILKILLKNKSNTGTINELSITLEEGFKQKAFFAWGSKIGIILILALLLLNFFAFTFFFNKASQLKESVSINRAGIENITKIRNRIKEKEEIVKEFTSQSSSKSSLIINKIVQNIPSSILLTEINYYPLQKKIKAEEPVLFDEKLITITGSTISNEAFTGWIAQIEKLEWINKVTIVSFGKNTENTTVFDIKIDLK